MFVFVMKCQREPVKGGITYIIAGLIHPDREEKNRRETGRNHRQDT